MNPKWEALSEVLTEIKRENEPSEELTDSGELNKQLGKLNAFF